VKRDSKTCRRILHLLAQLSPRGEPEARVGVRGRRGVVIAPCELFGVWACLSKNQETRRETFRQSVARLQQASGAAVTMLLKIIG
jgi:hypothetical protein